MKTINSCVFNRKERGVKSSHTRFCPKREIRGQVSWQKLWIYNAMLLAISWAMCLPRFNMQVILRKGGGKEGRKRKVKKKKKKQRNESAFI